MSNENNLNKEIIGSIMESDMKTPSFETPQEQLAFLKTGYENANREAQLAFQDTIADKDSSALLWRAEEANKIANDWFIRLKEFQNQHPELMETDDSEKSEKDE